MGWDEVRFTVIVFAAWKTFPNNSNYTLDKCNHVSVLGSIVICGSFDILKIKNFLSISTSVIMRFNGKCFFLPYILQ